MICEINCCKTPETSACQVDEERLCSGSSSECCTLDPDHNRLYRAACQIASDPQLFLKKINVVEQSGIIGERRNIGNYQLVCDSRLLPVVTQSAETLGLTNSGHQGAGKSATLSGCLKIYPPTAYHMISSGSAKSLYYIADGLRHKVLILAEGAALECRKGKDNPLTHSVRTLLSEGHLKYQVPVTIKGKRQTVSTTIRGPISLITTTIRGRLEEQLDDRMIVVHPNTSSEQTARIINQAFGAAAGNKVQVDEEQIEAWRMFHDMLDPFEVVVPYADAIGERLTSMPHLPISMRRGSIRILSAIKTITTLYQAQRQRDENGCLIAEMADYAMTYQLLEVPFAESLAETSRYADERVQFIAAKGMATQKMISEQFDISRQAVSKWLTPLVEHEVLAWCDVNGRPFSNERTAKIAKHSGAAYLTVTAQRTLPTPFEISGDPSWAEGGNLFKLYDLHLDDPDYQINQEYTLGFNLLTENCDDMELIAIPSDDPLKGWA